jgi:bacterioferritin-associated ferredoxin
MLVNALEAFDLRSLHEVRDRTGAGDGCTACHRQLKRFIERRVVSLPVIQASSTS